jgi:hypothetical protein
VAERANGILLDTSVVVAHLRGRIDLQSLATADEPLFLPLVALGELYRGVLKSARPEFNRAKVDEGYAHSGERHLDCSRGVGMRHAARYP